MLKVAAAVTGGGPELQALKCLSWMGLLFFFSYLGCRFHGFLAWGVLERDSPCQGTQFFAVFVFPGNFVSGLAMLELEEKVGVFSTRFFYGEKGFFIVLRRGFVRHFLLPPSGKMPREPDNFFSLLHRFLLVVPYFSLARIQEHSPLPASPFVFDERTLISHILFKFEFNLNLNYFFYS